MYWQFIEEVLEVIQITVSYTTMLISYVCIDFLWITIFMQPYFNANLGHLLRESINPGFLLFYGSIFFVVYVAGLYWFGVRAGLVENSPLVACLSGGLLGLLAYGTYGLTNFIFFKDYPLLITLLDITWGVTLGGLVSLIGYATFKFLAGS